MIVLSLLLCIVAWAAYASMYELQFKYSVSVFSLLNPFFWNPALSDKNKWETNQLGEIVIRNGKKVELFWGSSTIFVFLTDGWHLMQFIFENSIMLVIAINTQYHWYVVFLIVRAIYAITFNSLFDKLLNLKK